LVLFSCGTQNQPAPKEETKTDTQTTGSTAQPATDVVVFRNENGDIVCPVMGTLIPSTDKAAGGYRDYQGKRYYFCCAECAPKFDQNPEAYAEGKHLKEKSKEASASEKSEEAHDH
jgi:YHS domain-containing protein